MLALVFDTETAGLYQRKLPPSHPSQPEVLQLCAWLVDDVKVYSSFNVFIHGESAIPKEAYEVHRIDRDMTARVGISRLRACQMLDAYAKKADVIVGHNLDFDIGIMKAAFHREGGTGVSLNRPQFCTMHNSTNVCKIPHPKPFRAGEFKWPSLQEAYTMLVDPRGFDGAHDAEADVRATYEVYRVLRNNTN